MTVTKFRFQAAGLLAAFIASAVAIAVTVAASSDESKEIYKQKNDVPNLVNWLLTKEGSFFATDLIDWKQYDPTDPRSAYGMFAKKTIPKDTTLMILPQSALLKAGGPSSTTDEEHHPCEVVDQMVHEYKLGDESSYAPYIEYLFGDDSKKGKLPISWSTEGRSLLRQMVGDDNLLPNGRRLLSKTTQSYKYNCLNGEDRWTYDDTTPEARLEQDAYLFMISRSWTDTMVPLYDMINHRNGHYRNVDATSAHTGKPMTVYALRQIEQGEELYISYNECADIDCEGIKYEYMTPHILFDYGFVENYPRRWPINYDESGEIIVLEIYQNTTTGEKYAVWPFGEDDVPLTLEELNWIHAQMIRLRDLERTVFIDKKNPSNTSSKTWLEQVMSLESKHERETILDYYEGYKEALQMAIQYREYTGSGEDDEEDDDEDDVDYRPLTESTGYASGGYNTLVCLNGGGTSRDFHSEVETTSQYQEIAFTYNKDEDNTCLQLSGWIQACSAFRPHYHGTENFGPDNSGSSTLDLMI